MTSSREPIRNRLLATLPLEEFERLSDRLVSIDLNVDTVLIQANAPIEHVYFPESGIVSIVADTVRGRIEVGLAGRESVVGLPIVLGADRSPHSCLVQGKGRALRITVEDLRDAIRAYPSIFKPLGLYAQAFIVQIAQTAYANAAFHLEARLARWILMTQDRSESQSLFLTHEFLSVMLGVQRTSVTMAIHVLEGSGAIRATRGRIAVLDRENLIALAEDSYQVAENEYERIFANA